uniref:AlNc14C269G9943 protein n=1 Tax=Albugo laibachii Nc14 TaxID=890382 RepID=F0WUC2_9STRA|nr:AlNc14C269G9943 [Albugo laibachii Nc14]|eukprot:CCA25000.1 AlNc14C269G9943 [Albugo laibachii Nc14]
MHLHRQTFSPRTLSDHLRSFYFGMRSGIPRPRRPSAVANASTFANPSTPSIASSFSSKRTQDQQEAVSLNEVKVLRATNTQHATEILLLREGKKTLQKMLADEKSLHISQVAAKDVVIVDLQQRLHDLELKTSEERQAHDIAMKSVEENIVEVQSKWNTFKENHVKEMNLLRRHCDYQVERVDAEKKKYQRQVQMLSTQLSDVMRERQVLRDTMYLF